MPQIQDWQLPHAQIGVWQILEPPTFFLARLHLSAHDVAHLATMHVVRRTEWLAARWLLHEMTEGKCIVAKNEFGKPFCTDSSIQISFSHAHQLATVVVSEKTVGIDIERLATKLLHVAPRVLSAAEYASVQSEGAERLAHLHLYWGAKEALYKAYGRRGVIFSQHLLSEPFATFGMSGDFRGQIKVHDFEQSYTLFYRFLDDHVLVCAVAD